LEGENRLTLWRGFRKIRLYFIDSGRDRREVGDELGERGKGRSLILLGSQGVLGCLGRLSCPG
jgi:hypothetical protein